MTVIPKWTLADKLRKARHHAGADQRSFAQQLGVTTSAYAQWEAGRATPRDIVAIVKRIEAATDVDALWLLGLDPSVRHQGLEPRTRWLGVQRLAARLLRRHLTCTASGFAQSREGWVLGA